MKRLNGNSKLTNIILLFALIFMSSCSEKEYDTTLVYENTTNMGVKIAAYGQGIQPEVRLELYILPKESASKVITMFARDEVFERIAYFELSFSDGRRVKYERLGISYMDSDTNLFNLSLYDGNRDTGIYKLKISKKHYNESTKE